MTCEIADFQEVYRVISEQTSYSNLGYVSLEGIHVYTCMHVFMPMWACVEVRG